MEKYKEVCAIEDTNLKYVSYCNDILLDKVQTKNEREKKAPLIITAASTTQ